MSWVKTKLSKKLENDIEQYMFTFLSNSCEENLNFFKETLSKENKDVVINENLVVFLIFLLLCFLNLLN